MRASKIGSVKMSVFLLSCNSFFSPARCPRVTACTCKKVTTLPTKVAREGETAEPVPEVVEIPTEESGPCLVSTLESQYTNAIGLQYRNEESGAYPTFDTFCVVLGSFSFKVCAYIQIPHSFENVVHILSESCTVLSPLFHATRSRCAPRVTCDRWRRSTASGWVG